MAEFKGSELDMSRTRRLEIERNKQKQQLEQRKRDIKNQNKLNLTTINNRFAGKSDYAEELLKQETIGLVTLDDFNKKQLDIQLEERKRKREQKKKTKKKKKKEVQAAKLSFDFDDGDEEEEDILEMPTKRKKTEKEEDGKAAEEVIAAKGIGKDPTAMTSFLPDKERDQWERDTRLLLKKQFLLEQEQIKQELIDVTYSYWDGSGHRKVVTVKKGLRIDQFLDKVRQEFPELRSVSVESLLFVKEDLIIPHQITFYDLIISKARGKSGPLFDWTVHDDVRVVSDASKEKQESHAAKVVERRWYERNKHIFPASRWEIYDPAVQRESYTIRDTKKKATD